MVVVPFGFSIGDFITGTKLLISVLAAFKETSGASSKYASETAFLYSLTSTLQHLDDYVKPSPQNNLSSSISSLLDMVRGPLDDFKIFLDKYNASLGRASTKSKLGKVPKTVTYTLKDISGKVEKLRRQTEQPLQAINSLLSLQQIKSIEELSDQRWQPDQCAQIVEAIKVADIPTALDKQIQVLQKSASEHKIRQDEQLERVKDLRDKLDGELASLALSLEKVKDATSTDIATKSCQQAQLDASNDLQTSVSQLSAVLESGTTEMKESLKVQKDLLIVIKTFLEEKAAIQERAIAEADVSIDPSDSSVENSSWPSATLPAAYLAISLLSTVVSSVTAVSMVTQRQHAGVQMPSLMLSSKVADIPHTVSSATLESTISKSAQDFPSESPAQRRESSWVSEFSRSTGSGPTSSITQYSSTPQTKREESTITHVTVGGYSVDTNKKEQTPTTKVKRGDSGVPHFPLRGSDDTNWSKKISKLDESDSDSGGRNNDETPSHLPDPNYFVRPGPVAPPSNDGLNANSGYVHSPSYPWGYQSNRSDGGYIESGSNSQGDTGGGGSGVYSGGYSGGYLEGDSSTGGYTGGGSSGGYAGGGGSGGYSRGDTESDDSDSD
ncbi:hypothetical protein FB567DRAFT_588041 [Paraphoma chrysanthemicola]|uniref:Fungal N-terminal domain-containing protein n=1 Tax=Paraphoma chrysanthemicola TaxID=798071 RepID=A0A8K0W3A5_9PLEO|nr:hypothetical protein FB567DRAFT_588041 [Paraphoma chrysanthemicola]